MNYKRFRYLRKDKVFMDFAFFTIAFNIKKMCAKMTTEGMDWLIRLFYEFTVTVFRCWKHIAKEIFKRSQLKENELLCIVISKKRCIVHYDTPSFEVTSEGLEPSAH